VRARERMRNLSVDAPRSAPSGWLLRADRLRMVRWTAADDEGVAEDDTRAVVGGGPKRVPTNMAVAFPGAGAQDVETAFETDGSAEADTLRIRERDARQPPQCLHAFVAAERLFVESNDDGNGTAGVCTCAQSVCAEGGAFAVTSDRVA
jgi:hypothetical protein